MAGIRERQTNGFLAEIEAQNDLISREFRLKFRELADRHTGCYGLLILGDIYIMSLDKATVRRIANLARIEVPDGDLETVAGQLSTIIGWIEQLKEVNTDSVAPMSGGTDLTLKWRADAVNEGDNADKVLQNSHHAQDGFFTVPKVVE